MDKAIERGLDALVKLQSKDGSFPSLCSKDRHFKGSVKKETVFPTSLVLASLSAVKGNKKADSIAKKATRFLFSERSGSWTWNYAVRRSEASRPYPDDLDDTACALAALKLSGYEPGPAALAGFTAALVSSETREGGPYKTWIGKAASGWNDVDAAVNANIAYALALEGVFLDGLSSFIDSAARENRFESLYYESVYPFIYFISRFYALRTDSACPKEELASVSLEALGSAKNSLEASLAAASLARLGRSDKVTRKHVEMAKSGWQAHPLYIEKIDDEVGHYAGSEALTTAFAVEALALLGKKRETAAKEDTRAPRILERIREAAHRYFKGLGGPFGEQARLVYSRVMRGDMEGLIALLPYFFAKSLSSKREIDEKTLVSLGLANVLGWMGYTVQDDVIDEAKGTGLIPLSNVLIRDSLRILEGEAPDEEGKKYVRKVFRKIDEANSRECSSLLLPIAREGYMLPGKVPRVEEKLLRDKSFGHALGPLVILMRLGYAPRHARFRAVERFFEHYIIARQINDDAHDWAKDLEEGKINSASALVVRRFLRDNSPKLVRGAKSELEEIFWKESIDGISDRIRHRAKRAVAAARRSGAFESPEYAEALVEPLLQAAEKALTERDKSLEFLRELER